MFSMLFAWLLSAGSLGDQQPSQEDTRAAVESCVSPEEMNLPATAVSEARRRDVLGCVLRIAARQLNDQTPLQLDTVTTLRAVASVGTMMLYRYSIDRDVSEYTPEAIAEVERITKQQVCGNADMSSTIRMGGSYLYSWQDRNGRSIHQTKVDRC